MKRFKLLKFPLSDKKDVAAYTCAMVEEVENGRAKSIRFLEGACEKQDIRFHAEEVSSLASGDLVLVIETSLGYVLAHKLVNHSTLPRARWLDRDGVITTDTPVLHLDAPSIVLQASEDMILLSPDLKLN